jgi:hypothetical protein
MTKGGTYLSGDETRLEIGQQANLLEGLSQAAVEQLSEAIAFRYPHLTRAQRLQFTSILIGRIAKALREGREQVGFFEQHPDGSIVVKMLAIEEAMREAIDSGGGR